MRDPGVLTWPLLRSTVPVCNMMMIIRQPLKKGMDYNHLNVNHLRIHTSGLHADPSNYPGIDIRNIV